MCVGFQQTTSNNKKKEKHNLLALCVRKRQGNLLIYCAYALCSMSV